MGVHRRVDVKHLIISLLGMLTSVITAFPYALGTSGIGMPERCKYDGYGIFDNKTIEMSSQEIVYSIYSNHYYAHVNFYN